MFLDLLEGAYPQWHARALCNGDDPAKWFPSAARRGLSRDDVTADAREICERCPVLAACRADAVDRNEQFGVWGAIDFERANTDVS